MDADWTFSSCSWLWEDDNTFQDECIDPQKACDLSMACEKNPTAFSGDGVAAVAITKATEDSSLQRVTMCDDGTETTETKDGKRKALSGKASGISVRKYQRKPSAKSATQGMPWTEAEHRRFLYGLAIHGKGKWKVIAKDCVVTRTNAQVASHAQKYFQRMKRNGEGVIITNPTSTSPEKNSSSKEEIMTGNKFDGSLENHADLPSSASGLPYFDDISCVSSFPYQVPKDGGSVNAVPNRAKVSSLMLDKECQGTTLLPQGVIDLGVPSIWFP